jgi:hypothetical protein
MAFKDKEKAKEYSREWKRKWREKNPELSKSLQKERSKRYREKHPNNDVKKRCYYKYREKNIARVIKSNRARYRDMRLNCIEHYGNECACCCEKKIEFLAIDHIGGGGLKHRMELRKINQNIFEFLIKNNYPDGFRVLCHNCNSSHGHYGYCPHQIERCEITREEANNIIEQLRITRNITRNETKKKSNTPIPN